jgi:hypothetical protein
MGQNMASFCDLDKPQRAVLANPIKLAKDEDELCLALNQANWRGQLEKFCAGPTTAGRGITSRAEQQVCTGRRVYSGSSVDVHWIARKESGDSL